MKPDKRPLIQPRIKQFQPVMLILQNGGQVVGLYGLGEDNKMYIWEGSLQEWIYA